MQAAESQSPSADEKQTEERWNVILFEFLGTTLFIYGTVTCQNNAYAIALCYFGVLVLFARLSGGHFNPCVSLSLMLQGSINFSQFITYIIPQFAGAFLGGLLAFSMLNMNDAPYMQIKPIKELMGSLVGELIGSTIFLLLIQIQMIKQTQISHDAIISFIFLACAYFASREYCLTTSSSLLNPAAATSLTLFNCWQVNQWKQIANLWIFIAGPIIGSFLSAILYSKVYLNSQIKKQ